MCGLRDILMRNDEDFLAGRSGNRDPSKSDPLLPVAVYLDESWKVSAISLNKLIEFLKSYNRSMFGNHVFGAGPIPRASSFRHSSTYFTWQK